MGDRVAILRDGVLEQLGTPLELYEHPVNVFVAAFIGSPAMNLVAATIVEEDGAWFACFGGSRLLIPRSLRDRCPALARYAGTRVVLGLRPEDFASAEERRDGESSTVEVTVARTESLGSELIVYFSPNGEMTESSGGVATQAVAAPVERLMTARLDRRAALRDDAPAQIGVDLDRLYFFDADSGEAIG